MLLTDAGLGATGFGVLLVATRLLKLRFTAPAAPVATAADDNPSAARNGAE
jgi:hypothetical protein